MKSYKVHVVSDYRKIDIWKDCDKYSDARMFIDHAKWKYSPQLEPTEGMQLDIFEFEADSIRLIKSDWLAPKDTKSERRTCLNCRLYWGCRMSDNPRLDDDENGRPCTRWSAKQN